MLLCTSARAAQAVPITYTLTLLLPVLAGIGYTARRRKQRQA